MYVRILSVCDWLYINPPCSVWPILETLNVIWLISRFFYKVVEICICILVDKWSWYKAIILSIRTLILQLFVWRYATYALTWRVFTETRRVFLILYRVVNYKINTSTYVAMLMTVWLFHLCCFLVVSIVRFTQSTYRVNEDEGAVQFVLVLSHPASTNITVTVSSIDKSAKGKLIHS